MVSTKLLRDKGIKESDITHKNFNEIRSYFEAEKDNLSEWAEKKLKEILVAYFDLDDEHTISDMNGHTLAAAFRRFDIVEKCFKNSEWWENNCR